MQSIPDGYVPSVIPRRRHRQITTVFLEGRPAAPSVAHLAYSVATITLKPEQTAGRRAGLDCLQGF